MKREFLDRLPDPKIYQGSIYILVDSSEQTEIKFFKHRFKHLNGTITYHWSDKEVFPEGTKLKDL